MLKKEVEKAKPSDLFWYCRKAAAHMGADQSGDWRAPYRFKRKAPHMGWEGGEDAQKWKPVNVASCSHLGH